MIVEGYPQSTIMKVVHLSYLDNRGGSAKSALKIHNGLKDAGIDSVLFVSQKTLLNDDSVKSISFNKVGRFIDKKLGEILWRVGYPDAFYLFSNFFPLRKDVRQADIIQIYNIHGGYFSYKQLKKLSQKSILVWRLSDMWPITGHCAYSYECKQWLEGCNKCNDLFCYPPIGRDRCNKLWEEKRKLYSEINDLNIIAPSKWIMNCAKQSPLLQNKRIEYIPNGVDCSIFKPLNKYEAKKELGIDEAKTILLFSAANINDERKGLRYLLHSLDMLNNIYDKLVVICMGVNIQTYHKNILCLGNIKEEKKMAMIYSAADIYVLPTLADNLPNTILECMACRTATIAFDVGGIPDVIHHMETGYLVPPKDEVALANGIRFLFANPNERKRIADNAYQMIKHDFTVEIQTQKVLAYYKDILHEKGNRRA